MHHAWQIDDIRNLIFTYLSPRDLALLARTSRVLFDVATDALWRELTSIDPLWAPIPRECRHRPLELADLVRLKLYTDKVRVIEPTMGENEQGRTESALIPAEFRKGPKKKKNGYWKTWLEVWEEIATLWPKADFLPNLRRLRIQRASENVLVPLVGIAGMQLTELYIKRVVNPVPVPYHLVERLLSGLGETPHLKYLMVGDGTDLMPERTLALAPRLNHLRLDPCTHGAWASDTGYKQFPLRLDVLQKQSLEILTIGLTREWYSSALESLKDPCLPRLKALRLDLRFFQPEGCRRDCVNAKQPSWTCIGHYMPSDSGNGGGQEEQKDQRSDCGRRAPMLFFPLLALSSLTLLNLKLPLKLTGTMFHQLMASVAEHTQSCNLEELDLTGITAFNVYGRHQHPLMISAADVRQGLHMLRPLEHLQTLRISVIPNFLAGLEKHQYTDLAERLPALRTLHMSHPDFKATWDDGTPVEHVSLQELAAFCCLLPQLETVTLAALARHNPQPIHREWVCKYVRDLSIVTLLDSNHWRINNPDDLQALEKLEAAFDAYFPSVTSSCRNQVFSKCRLYMEVNLRRL